MEDGALDTPLIVTRRLKLIGVPPLVVHQAGEVVALVQKLENGREDLGFLVGESDALCDGVYVPVSKSVGEEG